MAGAGPYSLRHRLEPPSPEPLKVKTMKDTKLLDETLISLLRMPEAERTAEVIS